MAVHMFGSAHPCGPGPHLALDAVHSIPLVPRRVHPPQALGRGPRADASDRQACHASLATSPDVARKWYVYRGTRWMPEEQLGDEE